MTMLGDIIRAGFELGFARLRLRSRQAASAMSAPAAEPDPLTPEQVAKVDRVAFVIPRVAARLPWRSDCLVQALAAERWLTRNGVATTLTFGVPRDKPADFEAHAWLSAGDRVVTGGDIRGYVPLNRP